MTEPIIVMSAEEHSLQGLLMILESQGYRAVLSRSLHALADLPDRPPSHVIVVDLDTIAGDNQLFRDIKQLYPRVHIIVISTRPFHPELREAIVSHIDVCLSKPVNADELLYWLSGIFKDLQGPKKGPDSDSVD